MQFFPQYKGFEPVCQGFTIEFPLLPPLYYAL